MEKAETLGSVTNEFIVSGLEFVVSDETIKSKLLISIFGSSTITSIIGVFSVACLTTSTTE
jgi:hypothetical protein